MSDYFGDFSPEFQSGFCEGISAQHCLLVMIRKWKKSVDKEKTFRALLTDFSKAFDYLPHDICISTMKKSKFQQYFQCFIVCILGPYAFWFSH